MAEPVPSAVSNASENKKEDKKLYFDLNLTNYPKLLTTEEVTGLTELDIDEARLKLAELLDLKCEMETADSIITDYYFWQFWWAKCHLIQINKIEAVLILCRFLLNNLKTLKLDQEENLKQLKKLLSSSAVEVEERNVNLFSLDDLKQMLEFMGLNFFQHYRLYECCFRRHRKEMTIHHTMVIETIETDPFTAPLKDAMSENTFNNQIDPNYPPVYVSSHREAQQNVTFFLQKIHGN